jgi:hypothetical protein
MRELSSYVHTYLAKFKFYILLDYLNSTSILECPLFYIIKYNYHLLFLLSNNDIINVNYKSQFLKKIDNPFFFFLFSFLLKNRYFAVFVVNLSSERMTVFVAYVASQVATVDLQVWCRAVAIEKMAFHLQVKLQFSNLNS